LPSPFHELRRHLRRARVRQVMVKTSVDVGFSALPAPCSGRAAAQVMGVTAVGPR
jgi:hypothetical protein